jgi:DNA-binding beta-propeller fold protein YncE
MTQTRVIPRLAALAVIAVGAFGPTCAPAQQRTDVPRFQPEPFWPKPLPGNWILGQVSGIAVDRNDHIWIVHRPGTLVDDEKGAQKNPPANVWLAGNNKDDSQILKFAPDGKFLKQIGKPRAPTTSNAPDQFGSPAHLVTDDAAGEVYVADGYRNRRIIVLDAGSGAYKRHWGAYGTRTPHDDKLPAYDPKAALSQSFANPVHCVRISNDGLVYVCDRVNDRIQVFQRDGTFVKEFRVEPETLQNGSVWDLVLSEDPEQRFIFMADGANGQIVTLIRDTGTVLTQWGRHGRQPGQFKWVHNIAIDSKGNLYTAEVGHGRRVQKFRRVE